MRGLLRSFFLILLCAPMILGAPAARAAESSAKDSPLEVQNMVGNILLAGLVGGVMGLSTLSFYDKPQNNIRNIFFGAGMGMMVATLVMTLSVATSPIKEAAQAELEPGFRVLPFAAPQAGGVVAMVRF